jgi:hypothetical protein
MWDTFGHLEWDLRHRAGLLDDDDEFNYAAPLAPVKEKDDDSDEEEERDDVDDYHDNLAYLAEKAKENDRVDELPSCWKAWMRRRRLGWP